MIMPLATALPAHNQCRYYSLRSRAERCCLRQFRAAVSRVSMAETAPDRHDRPLLSFGVISDVQYANIPDGVSFHGVPRFYRNSAVALRRAVAHWQQMGLPFAIHFGDILDGFQAKHGKESSENALTDITDAFGILDGPTYHMLGNHCLYNLPRRRLNERLKIPTRPDGGSYYSFSPHPAWVFVVLDAYDISLLGWPQDHPRHLEAEAILDEHNPNKEKNSPEGLIGVTRRFVKFGGGLSTAQLEWLKQQIQDAEVADHNVIICSHLPLYPGTCPPACLLWNYDDVLEILHSSSAAVATIAGHTHQNGYLMDSHHIHHLVMPAVLETPPGRDAYGWVEVHPDKLLLVGVDTCMTCDLKLQPAAVQRQQRALQRLASSTAVSSSDAAHAAPTAVADMVGADIIVEVVNGAQQNEKEVVAIAGQLASCRVDAG